MKLSIVLTTYNRSAQVVATLRSIAAMTAPRGLWECVVVNNNSTDDTAAAVQEFISREAAGCNIRMVTECEQGLSAARNRGYAESRGEYIAFIDDDERVNADFAAAYIDLFDTHADASAAGGRVVAEYPAGRPEWMSPLVERPVANPMDFGRRVREFPRRRCPAGGNMAFRRSTLETSGVFDTALGRKGATLTGGEENDLFGRIRRAGLRVMYAPDAVIYHVIGAEKLTAGYLDRLSYNIGVSQRRRAASLWRLYVGEGAKWCAALCLAAWYCIAGRRGAARRIVGMRRGISSGIFGN